MYLWPPDLASINENIALSKNLKNCLEKTSGMRYLSSVKGFHIPHYRSYLSYRIFQN